MASSTPVASDGSEYNFFYTAGIVGAIIGIINGGFPGLLFIGIFGLVIGYALKTLILETKQNQLRYRVKFTLSARIPDEVLTGELLRRLMPFNITVEADTTGSPLITHNGVIYEIMYNDDNTFTVWWRKPIHKAIIPASDIKLYKKLVVSTGIIAYHIQQICNDYKTQSEYYR